MRFKVKSLFFDNISYKAVSLFIALILWLTILGRRDFTVTRQIEVEFLTSSKTAIVQQSSDSVKVKASGPRTALRRFIDSGASQVITIDLSQKSEGTYDVEIPTGKVDVPFGVKVQSLRPSKIQVQLVERKDEPGAGQNN